ncbi:conserved hypothetical protein [Candidatus Sulfopaludibacter sp. SbA6]|nr:conserved hypothetical protein [Candidatus Sulfopaludibacter sp. SbA6]
MSFHWLKMRITEEQERRSREAQIRERLPRALDELHHALVDCIESYTQAFGAEAAELQLDGGRISIVVREELDGQWQPRATVEIATVEAVPGFQIDSGGEPLVIEVGMLPGDKLFYRDRDRDQYVSMDELTHRALDRAFFPKLRMD